MDKYYNNIGEPAVLKVSTFLLEQNEEKLTHLEHAEDHVINAGMEGFAHAFHNLEDVKEQLQGKKNGTKITTKYDGSPSIVFGHNPDNGQFFVASKSAFNKNPKLNYTHEDVDENHGHAPGLAAKLKHALNHLWKVTPKTGVYQGDIMHSGVRSKDNPEGDIENRDGHFHFKPNTITYSTPHNSEEGKKIANSKFGVAVHTGYTGNTFDTLKADYGVDTKHFPKHNDVHVISALEDISSAKLTKDRLHTYEHHMKQATEMFKATDKKHYSVLEKHGEHLKTYINKTVREDTVPTVEGYYDHLKEKHLREIAKVKTSKSVETKTQKMQDDLADVEKHQDKLHSILHMHHHLQAAKDQLVHALAAKPKFIHTIDGKESKPEGYVVIKNNRPTKFVDRAEFSRANFNARPR